MIKKTDKGWLVDHQPGGRRGKRVRKLFATKGEAARYSAWLLGQAVQKPWNPPPPDNRSLVELIDLWEQIHGHTLNDGERRATKMRSWAKQMGNPAAHEFSPDVFLAWRRQNNKTLSKATLNNALAYFKALFNLLISTGEWMSVNPIREIKKIRIDERELAFLNMSQINDILSAAVESRNPHVELVIRLCLATGARWDEAESLAWRQLRFDSVEYIGTKNGKRRNIPIDRKLYEMILKVKPDDAKESDGCFISCYSACRKAFERADIELPKGQLTHVFRHTFASQFLAAGGSILLLQRVLDHSDLKVTMRYAHFAPEHMLDVLKYNPLSPLC